MYNEFLIDFEYVGKSMNKIFIHKFFHEIVSKFSEFIHFTDE